jgi:hypothetical protein
MKSIERGNSVIGVHINAIRGKDSQVKALGPNPFDYLGLRISSDGTRGTPTIWNGSAWTDYQDLGAFAIDLQTHDKRGKNLQLKTWLPTYDWVANNGFENFKDWVA